MKVMGVDRDELQELYRDVLCTSLRRDPELLVICNDMPEEVDFRMARTAFETGHNVMLVMERSSAPTDTEWLKEPTP